VATVLAELEQEMLDAANRLEFERAAILRDQIEALKSGKAGTASPARRARAQTPYRAAKKRPARR
jgi:excinuclease ABC subunit B